MLWRKHPWARAAHALKLREIAQDAPARALRLSPAAVGFWTDVITSSVKLLEKGERPCSTAPWRAALETHLAQRPRDTTPPLERASRIADLITLSSDIANPGWPEPRRDLIEFALAYLEGDVMLFRSGYTKKGLIRRLQQSPLTGCDIVRVDALLRRAVLNGTGLEEYRAYCRLAAHLVWQGHLPDLLTWLTDQAQGAIVDMHVMRYREWIGLPQRAQMSKEDLVRLGRYGRNGPVWGLVYPDMTHLADARYGTLTPQDKARRNAFRMIDLIDLRLSNCGDKRLSSSRVFP